MSTPIPILVLYYSHYGQVAALARLNCRGIEKVEGVEAWCRTVPPLTSDAASKTVPEEGAPYATLEELGACKGLALGSPTHFGNMAAPMKHFIDQTSGLWQQGALINKPACVFTSTSSLHGGQESTLISMMLPLIHHGMLVFGVPYNIPELSSTQTGGTPYGASHWTGPHHDRPISDEERILAIAQGTRLARIAKAQLNLD